MSSVRRLVAATTAAALCLVAAGCTSGAEDPAPSPSPTASASSPSAAGPVNLSFAVYGNNSQIEAYVDLADAFTKSNANVTVNVQRSPDSGAAMNKLASSTASGTTPDVFLMEHRDLPMLMAEQRIQPVDQLLVDREVDFGDGFQRAGLEAFSADTALQCMPHDVSPLVVYYNKDLLNPRSVVEDTEGTMVAEDGWTWEEFARAARQVAHGRVKGVYIEPDLEQLAPFIWSGGGELVDDVAAPTTLTLSEGDTRAALEEVLTLARDPQVTPTREELERKSAISRFKQGRIGMILGAREITPSLRKAADLDFEVMPLPTLGAYRTIAPMSGYCVSSRTENLEAAADFLEFAVSREGATITTTGGYVVPSNLQVAHTTVPIQALS